MRRRDADLHPETDEEGSVVTTAAATKPGHPHRSADRLPEPTSDVAQGLRNLRDHGVTLHKDFMAPATVVALRERLDEQAYMERKMGVAKLGGPQGLTGLIPSVPGDTSERVYQAVQSLVNKGRVFIDLFMNRTAHAYAEGMFAPWPWLLWGQNGIITRKGALEQFLHTDAYMLPPPMSTMPALINVFICVSDFDLDMGPTGFVPGSHLGPYMKFDGDEWSPRIPAVAKAGTAIIWEGRTWHGQCEHRSGKTRYSIAMSYCLWAFRSGENYPASLHDSVYETLNEDELRMLGFRSEMVGTMGVFGPRNAGDHRTYVGGPRDFVPEMHR
jgi:hypothetical protein